MSFAFGAPAPAPAPAPSAPSAPAPSALAAAPLAPTSTSTATATLPNARALFYALDETVQRGDVVDDATTSTLEDALEHVARACETYGPTRAASAEALRGGSVEYGGKTLRVSATTAKVATECARRLRLDETQTYVLLRRALDESEMPRPSEATEEVVREVMRFYFRERLGTIKCAHALLSRTSGDASSGADGDAWERAVTKMLDLGFEENVWRALDRHMSGASASGPEGASPEDAAAWAGQTLEETVALLEVLFLLYYNRVKCKPEMFMKLARMFEKGALRRAPAAAIELESHAPQAHVNAFTEDIRALCNVTLIAAMDLENLVDRFSGKSLNAHGFLEATVLKSITEMMEKWQSDAAHGPTLLAWSTFLTLLPVDAEYMPGGFSIEIMTQKANECGLSALSHLLDAEQLRGEDATVTLHKSVLKNMFSTILAAYDMLPVHRLPTHDLNQILSVLRKLLAHQPVLCEQFWGGAREDGQEAPLFALLEGCRERFPYDSAPLLRVLAAFSEGHRAAECALAYIAQLPTVALPVPSPDIMQQGLKPSEDAVMDVESGFASGSVTAIHRLTSPYIPGGFIEAGMSGLAIDMGTQTTPLIVWAAPADGLHLCLTRLSLLASAGLSRELTTSESDELDATTLFLSKVLTHAPSFARPMLSCDVSESVPKGSPTDILTGLSLALHVRSKSLHTEQSIQSTATVLQALSALAAAEPTRTVAEVLEAPLLSGTPGTGVPGLIRAIRDSESRLGEYPLTLAVLSLVETLLQHGGLGDKLEALVDHVLQEIAVRHVQWRYRHKAEKWIVHAAVQRIIYQIFTPRHGDFAIRLRDKVLSYLINDKAICFGSFAPLVYDAASLRKLHEEGGAPRTEEVTALEEAIATVLRSIPLIVYHAGDNFGGVLERMLLIETSNNGAPFASSIASYAGYPYAAACFPLALPALVPLCAAANAVPMAATLDRQDRAEILSSMQHMFKHADLDAVCDIADLLSAGIANQPEWVATLLVPEKEPEEERPASLPAPTASGALAAPTTPTNALAPTTPTTPPPPTPPLPTKTKKTVEGALALVWDILEDTTKIRSQSPRCLAALLRMLDALWRRQPLLIESIQTLKVKDVELWKRLATCVDQPEKEVTPPAVAHSLSAASSVLSLFAIEAESSMNALDGTSSATFNAQVREWCANSRISSWIDMCLSHESCALSRQKTQFAAQAFVLQCISVLEREDMSAKRSPLMADATLQWMCGKIRDALLSHASAKDLRASGASNVAILEAVAREAATQSPSSIMSADAVHRLVQVARDMHVEAVAFAPAPLSVAGTAEYGESYLYDSYWIRVATGCVGSNADDQWGAPEGALADMGRAMSAQLAETCLLSSITDAQSSAICSLSSFIAAAAFGELPKMHAGVFTQPASTTTGAPKTLLDGLSRDSRRDLVLNVAERLQKIIVTDSASMPSYVSPLANEMATLLSVVTQLWSVSVSSASPQTPAENDFEPVQRVILVVSTVLAPRTSASGSPSREAASLVNPLLTAMLFAIRAWRAGMQSAKTVQPSYELGQSALPLIPLICQAAAGDSGTNNAKASTTSSVALMLLADIASDLLPTSALLQVLSTYKIMPALRPATGDDDVDSVTIAALNTCLSLSKSDQGAEILLASDTVRLLAILCVESNKAERHNTTNHDIYCSALRVTAMLAGSPLAVHSVDVGADLVRFCAALEARMLAALAPKEITLATLKEVEVTALFFSRLASTFGAQWQVSSPEGQMRCRVACVSFLRWFAAPQVVGGLRCPRKTRADETLAAKPPATRATQAWFQATARGDSVREPTSPLIGTAPHGSPIADASTRKTGNAYSEAVAVALYRAARAACDFLAVFPRAVDQAALGFDVTASLRDQCDALSCDDLTSSPANADESALVAALDGLKSAASKIERLEASSLKPSDARADGSPRPRVAASSPFA